MWRGWGKNERKEREGKRIGGCGGKKKKRTEQDSNLRGQSPLDFESNALTTRPSVLTSKLSGY